MARIRNFVCYRDFKRPYSRFSKYRKFNFVRVRPALRLSRFTSGVQRDYGYKVHLVTKHWVQVRDNAMESARLAILRPMEKELGKAGFFMQLRTYPHHMIRENPLAAGAGADRLSTGMKHNFGKIIGVAAQLTEGQALFTLHVAEKDIPLARNSLKRAKHKLPFQWTVQVEKTSEKKPTKKTGKVGKNTAPYRRVKALKAVEKRKEALRKASELKQKLTRIAKSKPKKTVVKPESAVVEKPKVEVAQ